MSDREQIRRRAELSWMLSSEETLRLLAELEQAEWRLDNASLVVIPEYERRLAKADKLVEALREADAFLADPDGNPIDSLNFAHRTLRAALADFSATHANPGDLSQAHTSETAPSDAETRKAP